MIALRSHLFNLEAEVATLRQSNRPVASARTETPRSKTPEEQEDDRQRAYQDFEVQVHNHWQEASGGDLPQRVAPSVGPRMEALSLKHGARFRGLDCRTSSCLGTVEFTSFHQAIQHYAELVTTDYGVRCASMAMLPEPNDPDRPYLLQILLKDC